MHGMTTGIPAEVMFKSVIALGKMIGFDVRKRLSIPGPATVRKLLKLTRDLSLKNSGSEESGSDSSTKKLLKEAAQQHLLDKVDKEVRRQKRQAAIKDAVSQALALADGRQSEADASGAENSGTQSSSAQKKADPGRNPSK